MNKQNFHGSDIDSVANYYGLDKAKIINFAGNVNPLGTSKNCLKTLANHLDLASDYPDRNYSKLKHTISMYCHTDTDNILIGNGSTELISLGIKHIGASKALILGPTYSEYKRELDLLNCTLDEYTLSYNMDFKLELPHLLETLKNDFDFLIICNPNNPTGTSLNQDLLGDLLTHCKQLGVFVMIDETYIEFSRNISTTTGIPLIEEFDNLLVLRGYSKFFAAPGIRLGYGITSNKKLLNDIHANQNPWSVSSYAEFLGTILLDDKDYIEKTQHLIKTERRKFENAFTHSTDYKLFISDANFFLVQLLNPAVTSGDIFENCIKSGLFIRDCNSFFHEEGEFIRFCIMMPEDNDRLISTLKNIR